MIAPGTERWQGRTTGTTLAQVTILILRGVEGCEVLGVGMLYRHREVIDQEVRETEDDQFISPLGSLHDDSQCVLK